MKDFSIFPSCDVFLFVYFWTPLLCLLDLWSWLACTLKFLQNILATTVTERPHVLFHFSVITLLSNCTYLKHLSHCNEGCNSTAHHVYILIWIWRHCQYSKNVWTKREDTLRWSQSAYTLGENSFLIGVMIWDHT